jgi:chemotaxis-related protein WspD
MKDCIGCKNFMTPASLPHLQTCWTQIGIAGDRSCPELLTHTHCRNCPVYSTEGRRLLERNTPDGYVQEWTTLLSTAVDQTTDQRGNGAANRATGGRTLQGTQSFAVVIFRVHSEWLALPAHLFKEVTPFSSIHTIPHRSNQILLGLVNIRGELQMCVSLAHLLMLEAAPLEAGSPVTSIQSQTSSRLMVLERESDRWVFPVNEIYGVQRFQWNELKPAPTNVAKSTNTYTKGLLSWRDTHVSCLDDELLFYNLSRRVL